MDNGESSFLTKTEGMSNFLSCSWKFYGRSLELAVNVRRSSLEAELKTGEGFMKHEVSLCLAISISHFSSLAVLNYQLNKIQLREKKIKLASFNWLDSENIL